jgi:hypothetical protein
VLESSDEEQKLAGVVFDGRCGHAWPLVVGRFPYRQSVQSSCGRSADRRWWVGGVLEIKQQDVSVVINNGIAVTEIKQVFLNTENRIVEALYTFPVPNGASVSNFSMIINGQEMIGEVVEKQRARQIYESYKVTKRDPGLLEQVDYKTFELRVFPIQPKAEQHIKIVYYQQLDFDHNNATYVYPLATNTRGMINEKTFLRCHHWYLNCVMLRRKRPRHAEAIPSPPMFPGNRREANLLALQSSCSLSRNWVSLISCFRRQGRCFNHGSDKLDASSSLIDFTRYPI